MFENAERHRGWLVEFGPQRIPFGGVTALGRLPSVGHQELRLLWLVLFVAELLLGQSNEREPMVLVGC